MKDLKNPKNALELLGINIPEPPVIPYAPETESEEETSPLVMPDRLNELAQEEALEQSIPEPAPSINNTKSSPSSAPTSTPNSNIQIPKEQSILELYKKMRADQEKAIMDSRKRDNDNATYDQIMRGTDKIANAFANRSGITNINNKHESLKSDFEKLAKEDTSRSLQDLLQEYNMKRQASQDLLNAQKAEADRKYKQDLLQLERDKLAAQERLSAAKKDDALEREIARDKRKEEMQIAKEDRKLRNELDKAESAAEEQLKALEDAYSLFKKYSKNSITGTGPIATLGGVTKYLNSDTERLDSKLKNISLDSMIKMFAGMSKVVDSDAERRAFESTQPSIALDDETNRDIFETKIKAVKSLLEKTRKAKQKFDKSGTFDNTETSKSIPPIGSIITSKGRKFRVIDEAGNLEEVK